MKKSVIWSFPAAALVMAFAAAATAQQRLQNTTATSAGTVSGQIASNSGSAGAPGAKPGSTGNIDGAVYQVGGSIKPPVAIHTPDPKFSKQAKKAKFSGIIVVSLIVGTDGKPHNVHILRGAGMGLDEQALKAVQKYKFKPATRDGKPVAVYINVEVNFQIT